MSGAVLSTGTAAIVLFGLFFLFLFLRVPIAFALALASLPILTIEPRLSVMTLAQETFNAYNSFILLAVPFFLLTANLARADQRRAVDLLRRDLRLLDRRRSKSVEDLHPGATQGRL